MPEDEQIERCALICDAMVAELEDLKTNARKSQYDRQSTRQIDYAIRIVRRVADRIRALKSIRQDETGPVVQAEQLNRLIAIVEEMRPILASARPSAWKQDMLRQINEILGK